MRVNKTKMILFGVFLRRICEIFKDDLHFTFVLEKEVWEKKRETERRSRVRHKIQFE